MTHNPSIEDLLNNYTDSEIAIIGLAARLPGANNVDTFWENLRDGVEARHVYDEAALRAAGVSDQLLDNPDYVKSGFPLDRLAQFDAAFFNVGPQEAAIMDPQHRHFLECAWEALEHAGHPPARFEGAIGVYAGSGHNAYLPYNLLTNPQLVDSVGFFLLRHTGNDKDFLTTRASHCFNLTGPSINIQTACSTSLVAVHAAAQSLLQGECDLALAGGVTIEMPHHQGYLYREGEILSPDGHCRPFDAASEGVVFGSGVGVVVLRRLDDALKAGDTVHAVILGSAINNDGANKSSYLAPSVDGQAAAISEAIEMADISADSIGYVETHGTGTKIGDPIEITALTKAFQATTSQTGFCKIGSVKSNIGHLDTAAGVASLIKTVLALKHRHLPPSLHFSQPNPLIDFASSPFRVNATLTPWQSDGQPRRAGVNSLGVGGTNAHVILEEAPELEPTAPPARAVQLFPLSARSQTALVRQAKRLRDYLQANPTCNLADVAYTLQVGRQPFEFRQAVSGRNQADLMAQLEQLKPNSATELTLKQEPPRVVFMFPGGGAQHPNMGRALYEHEPVYRHHVDACLALLHPRLGFDVRELLFPQPEQLEQAAEKLLRPSLALPTLFTTCYALAQQWLAWGITPTAMIGHSVGEYVAACLAEVMSLAEALSIVALRGELFERVPEGGMVSVAASHTEVEPWLTDELSLAVVNAPNLSVLSGSVAAIEALEARLAPEEIPTRRIKISVAAHSAMLEPILDAFGQHMATLKLKPPQIPFVSNVTGSWITPDEATDPTYWVRHLRQTVRFADGIRTLAEQPNQVCLEVGPGRGLAALIAQHPDRRRLPTVVSMPSARNKLDSQQRLLQALGGLWANGVEISWTHLHPDERRQRLPLPTYPFDHQRHWIEPGQVSLATTAQPSLKKIAQLEDWFARPVWKQSLLPRLLEPRSDRRWLIFVNGSSVSQQVVRYLTTIGQSVITVAAGTQFQQLDEQRYRLNPTQGEAYIQLMQTLQKRGELPHRILHLWLLGTQADKLSQQAAYDQARTLGFDCLLLLAQALIDLDLSEAVHLDVVTIGLQQVHQEPATNPANALVLGPCRVIPQELPHVSCRAIDLSVSMTKPARLTRWRWRRANNIEPLLAELTASPLDNQTVALRGETRWTLGVEAVDLPTVEQSPLRAQGVYLITGGLGGIGLILADYLARTYQAKLILTARSALPERDSWADWLRNGADNHPTRRRIETVQRLEALGAEVLLTQADVSDLAQMAAVIEQASDRFGTIHGIFHAAGIMNDQLILQKDVETARQTLRPKVEGTLVLVELLPRLTLDFCLLFSSTSAMFGLPGQIDYAAANAFLDAVAVSQHSQSRPPLSAAEEAAAVNQSQGRLMTVDWGMWQNIGMTAVDKPPLSVEAADEMDGVSTTVNHPLLDCQLPQSDNQIRYGRLLSPQTDWLLDQHRLESGVALIPGTGYLALAQAALNHHVGQSAVEMKELYFIQPFALADDQTDTLYINLTPNGEGYALSVKSKAGPQATALWQEHVQGSIKPLDPSATAKPLDVEAIQARCQPQPLEGPTSLSHTQQEEHLRFGPRWHCLEAVYFGEGEALAALALPEPFRADIDSYHLHPALLDIATSFALPLIPGYGQSDSLYVPLSYRAMRVYAPMPAEIYSYIRPDGQQALRGLSLSKSVSTRSTDDRSAELAAFNITICSRAGETLIEIDNFLMKQVDPAQMTVSLQPDRETATTVREPVPPLLRLAHRLGITPAEGMQALERVLQSRLSQVVVSTVDLDSLEQQIKTTREAAADTAATVKLSRPELKSEYHGPRNEMERELVALWGELLGVEEVGIHDDFFELGGHSLIAVRLFTRIRKLFSIDLTLSTMFEASTIAELSELIAQRGRVATVRHSAVTEYSLPTQWSPLAAIQPHGALPPFFCVHGIHGNVLNFQPIASSLGSNQPLYALQAFGVDGFAAPLANISEMARIYIEAIRTVQPEGPYRLSGFSLGGEIAYEMAQQLQAEGQTVKLLVLFDTFEPEAARNFVRSLLNLPKPVPPVSAHKGEISVAKASLSKRFFRKRSLSGWLGAKRLIARYYLGQMYRRLGVRLPQTIIEANLEITHHKAVLTYHPQPYRGRMLLFRAQVTESAYPSPDPTKSWDALASNLTTHYIDCSHSNMVQPPYIESVATVLKQHLHQ